jgi:hypothetical protein
MAQNPDFPAVSRCAARKIRRLAKSGIKQNQWVSVINEIATRAKLADLLAQSAVAKDCFGSRAVNLAMSIYRPVTLQ